LTDSRALAIYTALKKRFNKPELSIPKDPFQVLIITVISQHTNDKNTVKAYQRLKKEGLTTPQSLASTSEQRIADAIKVAGLFRNKSKTLKRLAEEILKRFNGDLNKVLELPLEQARDELMKLPGVGPKTADVLLTFCSDKPTIPVDTHVNRVSKRLGLAPKDAGYEEVRLSLQKLYEPKDYLDLHLLLIALGRAYCKARKPLCLECPVKSYCPSAS